MEQFTFFCGVLKLVVASAVETELGGVLFLYCKECNIIRLVLEELGHKQPTTPVYCYSITVADITKIQSRNSNQV